jgi:AraC family transcriptional regulator
MGMSNQSFADFYRAGALKHLDQLHYHVGTAGLRMFRADNQPAGCVDVPPMTSATLQLALHGNGTGRFDFGAGRFSAACRPGAWLVTPPNQQCRFDLDFGLSVAVLELPDTVGASDLSFYNLANLHSKLHYDPAVAGLVRTIWEDRIGDNRLGALWEDTAIATLQGMLMRTGRSASSSGRSSGGLAAWQTRRVTEYMVASLDQPVTLAQLADLCGLSTFHFARAFKISTNVSPHRYLTTLRIDQARQMLQNSTSSVTEIAFAVGYETSQALARAFMRELGVTPSAWRRQNVSRS